MSECGPDCGCAENKARKLLEKNGLIIIGDRSEALDRLTKAIEEAKSRCPQACGGIWPECGCPTAEMKQAVADAEEAAYRRGRTGRRWPPRSRGKSIRDMMIDLGRREP